MSRRKVSEENVFKTYQIIFGKTFRENKSWIKIAINGLKYNFFFGHGNWFYTLELWLDYE